jgi:hypothetical protein
MENETGNPDGSGAAVTFFATLGEPIVNKL